MSESPTTRPSAGAVPRLVPAPSAASTAVPGSIPGFGSNPTTVPGPGANPGPVPTPVPGVVPTSGSVPPAVLTTVPIADPAPVLRADGPPGSVWLTGQQQSRALRRGRYTPASITHPGKMLPTIARYAIRTYTDPGDLVLDPMAGIGTTMVEAMHLDRHGVGVEYESRWAALASINIALAEKQGAPGTGAVYTGDSRHLSSLLPPQIRGRVALVITSPPYGPSVHGRAVTPGREHGKVRRIYDSYGEDSENLAYRNHDELADGFTEILIGCHRLLRPGGHVVVTARPYRRNGELVDIPGMVVAAGESAGLELVEECVALIAGVRHGRAVDHASFFQRKNVRNAAANGDPQWLTQHEDVLILTAPSRPNTGITTARDSEPIGRASGVTHALEVASGSAFPGSATTHAEHGLDLSAPPGMDRRPQPAPPATTHPSRDATAHRPDPGREAERTAPCPPYSHATPASVQTAATGHYAPRPHTGASAPAGRR